MPTRNILVQSTLAAFAMSFAGAAAAQSPIDGMYIKMGAASYAMAAVCGASEAELVDLQATITQQARAAQPALPADFDRRMDAAIAEQKSRIADVPPAERAKACQQIEQGMKQMQQQLQP